MSDHPVPTIPVICGPTGAGKTGAALKLAETHPIEIVSADSRQIIRRLNIGTAKPTAEEQRRVPFHLMDIIEPGERYSAYQFLTDADRIISDILARGKHPVVVGGTGLYIQALTDGVIEITNDDSTIRERLENELDELGPDVMHARLAGIDPVEAERIHPNNRVRVIRALEIFELTGTPKSSLTESGAYKRSGFAYSVLCLAPPRETLYDIINKRTEQMVAGGLLNEVEGLVREGLGEAVRRSNVIGYAELMDYLDDLCTLDEAIALIQQNTRRYAKRQMTWFRHRLDCRFFADADTLMKEISFS